MKFSENWLRTWINPSLTSHELSHKLTMAGLEVEALEPVSPAFNQVVVAEVLEVVRHPNADRLNVCQVDVGEAMPVSIVCGASNVAVGIKVPCARIGAELPGGLVIKQAKVRKVESNGMLCSADELGLSGEGPGLLVLPEDAPVGRLLREYLDLDDMLFTVKLTPNRSDCLSIVGIAREVAAMTGGVLNALEVEPSGIDIAESVMVSVDAPEACPLYCGRIVRGVNGAANTPSWMVRRLERSGLRSINAIVDITNYVMIELGQPLHAYNLEKVAGNVTVRFACKNEELVLLNDQKIILRDDMLVIADDARPLALAGIMGGAETSVQIDTRDVFLESAFFIPDAVVGKARRLNISTDSAYRFERGVDFSVTRTALERATNLLLEICGGQAGIVTEAKGELPARDPIRLRTSRVERVLGISIDNDGIAALLQCMQLKFALKDDDFYVIPPSFRFDIVLEVDLIEEIARLIGYDNILVRPSQTPARMIMEQEALRPVSRLRQIMVARDYQETISYAFHDADVEKNLCGNARPVTLKNPISSQMTVMRSSLLGGLIGALRINLTHKQSRVRLFETGVCFSGEEYSQQEKFGGLCYGAQFPEQWGVETRTVDFYDVKADVEALFFPAQIIFYASPHPASHPGRSAEILLDGNTVGWIGELHPQWLQQYEILKSVVWFEVDLHALTTVNLPRARDISKFPPVRRDIAVIVDESVTVQSLINAMQSSNIPYVVEIGLFDLYRGASVGDGKKSLAFRVLLQDTQKTLTDSEIEQSIALLIAVLQQQRAQLRI